MKEKISIKKRFLNVIESLWYSLVFSASVWTIFFVENKYFGIRDYSDTVTLRMYCILVLLSAIAWAILYFCVDKHLKKYIYDDGPSCKYMLALLGTTFVLACFIWGGFCLLMPASPSGIVPFILLLLLSMHVLVLFILVKNIVLLCIEEIKDFLYFLFGIEEIEQDIDKDDEFKE